MSYSPCIFTSKLLLISHQTLGKSEMSHSIRKRCCFTIASLCVSDWYWIWLIAASAWPYFNEIFHHCGLGAFHTRWFVPIDLHSDWCFNSCFGSCRWISLWSISDWCLDFFNHCQFDRGYLTKLNSFLDSCYFDLVLIYSDVVTAYPTNAVLAATHTQMGSFCCYSGYMDTLIPLYEMWTSSWSCWSELIDSVGPASAWMVCLCWKLEGLSQIGPL